MARFNPLQFSLINDEPVADPEDDLLGAGDPAQQLAALLVDSSRSTPFTLAVESGWGTGKSSLMRLVEAELKARDVPTVWYNAWTSTGEDALEGLIKSVLRGFDRRVLRRALQRVSERWRLVNLIRALVMLVAGPLGVTRVIDELWKGLSVSPQARNRMREEIKKSVEEWAENGEYSPGRLLVVFIDDLDRCSEETVLAVCEAVKVYLDVPGLAFVIGCDRSALDAKGLLRDLSPTGSAFMEKIFQTTYRIPEPDGSGIEEFVRRCACDSGIDELLNAGLYSRIAEHSRRNPRRIKKLINGFVLEVGLNLLWRDFVSTDARSVISTLVLQHFYPDFYRMLVGSGSGTGGAYGDVLTEFQTYRRVRLRLRLRLRPEQVEDGVASDEEVADFFAQHLVRRPLPADMDAWKENLDELEQELPREFPDLATDSVFTSLVDDLEQQPRYEELIRRLRQRPPSGSGRTSQIEDLEEEFRLLPLTAEPPAPALYGYQGAPVHYGYQGPSAPHPYQGPLPQHPGPQDASEPSFQEHPRTRAQPLADMRILWIDDNPASVELDVRAMRAAGAYVEVVENRAEAERHLTAEDHDLLISDITRGADHEAGFTDVEGLSRGDYYSGPVIFYTGRITPAREAKARELRAGITSSPNQLMHLVVAAGER